MTKTNFSKVEEFLDSGLRKIKVDHLLDLADAVSGTADKSDQKKIADSRTATIHSLQRDLKELDKLGKKPYQLFGIKKETVISYATNPRSVPTKEWEKLKAIRLKVVQYKNELNEKEPQEKNEDLVERERRRHVTKRFNINDRWLPLR